MGASVTRHAVGEVRYAFADMLGANIGFGMLVAAVAGVLPPVVGRMAGGSGDVMILIEHKKAGVIEGGWFPAVLAVALRALAGDATVDCRRRSDVARGAILPDCRIE
jgi:hypothetical protein